MQHDFAACLSMFQPDMLPPVNAYRSWTCCCLFKHVAAGHVAAFSTMLQPDMLPPLRACCSQTCCRLFKHIAAGHVVTCLSILQPDLNMLQPVQVQCRSPQCRKVQEQVSRYIQVQLCPSYIAMSKQQRVLLSEHFEVQLRPLCCRHIQKAHMIQCRHAHVQTGPVYRHIGTAQASIDRPVEVQYRPLQLDTSRCSSGMTRTALNIFQ